MAYNFCIVNFFLSKRPQQSQKLINWKHVLLAVSRLHNFFESPQKIIIWFSFYFHKNIYLRFFAIQPWI